MTDRASRRNLAIFAAATICFAGAREVGAVVPSFWNVRTQAAFSSGELNNITVDSRGMVTLSPPLDMLGETGELYIWSLARDEAGVIYAGTGNEGKIFKLAESGELSLWCDLQEPDVLSLVSGDDGELFAGTSASGTIYRIDPSGEASVFYETGARYVWTLVRDDEGTIYAGSGDAGRVYRVDAEGAGSLLFDSPETHIMTLIPGAKPGSLYAGGEGRGIVYEISLESGRGFVMHEVAEREVSALALAADGTLYVGATSGPVPGPEAGQTIDLTRPSQGQGGEVPKNTGIGAASPDSSSIPDSRGFGGIAVSTGPSSQMAIGKELVGRARGKGGSGGSALYAIAPDGVVSEIWRSPEAALLSLAVVGEDILIGTGNKGYVYRVNPAKETSSTLVQSSASQITSILPGGRDRILVGAANMADLMALGTGNASSGTIESPAHDASSWSQWGRLNWEGDQPKGTRVQISTRAGNTSVPDSSWSEWASVEGDRDGPITSPNSRFLQWRAELESSKSNRSPVLRSVSVSYQQRNLKPEVLALSISPAAGNSAPKGPSANGGRSPSTKRRAQNAIPGPSSPLQPARGESTIRWQAHDANGDALRHSLFFREFDAKDGVGWKMLEEGLEATSHRLDSSALPDGLYVIKAVSSDELDNPAGTALAGELVSDPFAIDNTNPEIVTLKVRRQETGTIEVNGTVEDGTGPLWKGYFAINGGEWTPFFPTDGIFDSRRETFTFLADVPEGDEHTLVVRVSDLAGNVGAKRIEVD